MPPTAEPRCRGTHSAEGQVTWHYSGRIDGLVGTGATGAERALGYGSAAVLTLLIVGDDLLRVEPVAQAGWQVALLALFAFDIAGGAVANMLNSCKRLYHSPPRPEEGAILRALKNPRLFTALHVHPLLIVWAFGGSLAHAAIWYLLLQVAVWGGAGHPALPAARARDRGVDAGHHRRAAGPAAGGRTRLGGPGAVREAGPRPCRAGGTLCRAVATGPVFAMSGACVAGGMKGTRGRPTVLVAGASGYLGRHLVAEYKARGWQVRALVRSRGGGAAGEPRPG